MEMNFCRRCGAALTNVNEAAYECENHHLLFTNPAPCVGVFFVTEDKEIILSVRGIEPFKGMLDSFGGFVDEQETAEEAAWRELHEELGLTPEQYEPLRFISTETGVYPYGGEDRSILGTFFWSRLKPTAVPQPADDVSEIIYVPLADVDVAKINNSDVKKAIVKLQSIVL